jgi:hypothetical protein
MGLFPFLFAVGAGAMERNIPKIINLAYIAVAVFVLLITIPFAVPVFSFEHLDKYAIQTNHIVVYPFSRWEDGKDHGQSQVFSDMTGWEELTSYVEKLTNSYHPQTGRSVPFMLNEIMAMQALYIFMERNSDFLMRYPSWKAMFTGHLTVFQMDRSST